MLDKYIHQSSMRMWPSLDCPRLHVKVNQAHLLLLLPSNIYVAYSYHATCRSLYEGKTLEVVSKGCLFAYLCCYNIGL